MSSEESSSSEEQREPTPQEVEASLRIIGALAQDIRDDWSNIMSVMSRLFAMTNLAVDIKRQDLVDWLKENKKSIYSDGRTLRDWSGPYGTCTRADLTLIDLPTFMFSSPETAVSDYDSLAPDQPRA